MIAANRLPAKGQAPPSRSAFTNCTPGIICGSRSTAMTSSPRSAKKTAWRPAPEATSSTGPAVTRSAQRRTHSEASSAELNVAKPVSLSSRQAIVGALAVEARWRAPQQRCGHAFEGVDAHHGIQVTLDVARDDRDDAATGADVEVGGPRAELVWPSLRRIAHRHHEHATRVGGPHAAMLGAERAVARARRNLGGFRLPLERERDIAAVAATVDEHARSPCGCDRAT